MKHESMRELIALRLYGELDETERTSLEHHLEGCSECRRYAEEIATGLGSIRRPEVDLPSDWSRRLREATRESPRVPLIRPWWTAIAAFAAGVIAAAVIGRGPSEPVRPTTTWARFHTESTPPLATTESQLQRLGEYLNR